MTPEIALFLSSDGIALAHRQPGGSWARVGHTPLDTDDLANNLAAMHQIAVARAGAAFKTLLVLPDEQILYTTITAPGPDDVTRMARIRERLDGLTPYKVKDLVFDWLELENDRVKIAVIARETLAEANAFATKHGFSAVAFAADPKAEDYPLIPVFGTNGLDALDLGPQGLTDGPDLWQPPEPEPTPEPEAVLILPKPITAAAPLSDSAPEPEPEPEAAPEIGQASQAAEKDTYDDAPVTLPSGFGARRGAATPSTTAGKLVSERKTRFAVGLAKGGQIPTPIVATAAPERIATGLSASDRAASPPAARPTTAPVLQVDDPRAPIPRPNDTLTSTETPQQDPPAVTWSERFRQRTTRPSAIAVGAGSVVDPVGDAPITNGLLARKVTEASSRGPTAKVGLILTLVLLVMLALVAIWSVVFLPDSRLARLLSREPGQVIVADLPPAPFVADDPEESSDLAAIGPDTSGAAPESFLETAALPDIDADIDMGPAPATLETLLPTEEETTAFYAQSGVWQRPPVLYNVPQGEELGEISVSGLDEPVRNLDALALYMPEFLPSFDVVAPFPSPAPAGTTFVLDETGRVRPTPQGALSANGVLIFAGAPPVASVPRPTTEADVAAVAAETALTDIANAVLGTFRPTARPSDLGERVERQQLGGLTSRELAGFRPTARPLSVQQLAQEAVALTAAQNAIATEITGEDTAAASLLQASPLAISASRMPILRPADMDRIVASATASAPQTQTAAAPAAVVTTPNIPSSASVTRAATIDNAVNLREVSLIGVSGAPSDRTALVRLPSGRILRLGVGDRVDGGQVAAIGESTLQYVKSGRSITLEVPSG
ncbi:MAG: hypothetical protein ACI81Q_000671 [Paracoccaceae bacterium]|jgi:hypothetical protein